MTISFRKTWHVWHHSPLASLECLIQHNVLYGQMWHIWVSNTIEWIVWPNVTHMSLWYNRMDYMTKCDTFDSLIQCNGDYGWMWHIWVSYTTECIIWPNVTHVSFQYNWMDYTCMAKCDHIRNITWFAPFIPPHCCSIAGILKSAWLYMVGLFFEVHVFVPEPVCHYFSALY